jgi:hypothetical protein
VARAVVLAGTGGDTSEIERSARLAQLARLRENLGLMRKSDLDAWMARNGLDESKLEALLEAEARLDAARRLPEALIEREILALLHLSDSYADLAERARRKAGGARSDGAHRGRIAARRDHTGAPRLVFPELRRQPVPDISIR